MVAFYTEPFALYVLVRTIWTSTAYKSYNSQLV